MTSFLKSLTSILRINNKVIPKLGARLSLIASMVPDGAAVCDVGTDHGLLPSYLYLGGKMRLVSATDINEAPLLRAEETVKKYGACGVRLILCDGLSGVEEEFCDTVIIAGMGGEVIGGIIDRCRFAKNGKTTFILQPMTGADELRGYLAQNGFNIIEEPCVCEHGKVWSVMLVRYDGVVRNAEPLYLLTGRVCAKTEAGFLYIKKQYMRVLGCAESLNGVSGQEDRFEYFSSLALKIKNILEEE